MTFNDIFKSSFLNNVTSISIFDMVLALLRGDLRDALGQNLFMLIFLPGACIYIVVELTRYVLGMRPLYRYRAFCPVLCAVLLLGLLFTVLRNLPGFQWLAPSWAAA